VPELIVIMNNMDPSRLSRISDSVVEGLSVLLDYLQVEGIADWHQRYAGIREELERGNYDRVVQMVGECHKISSREVNRMDLICHEWDGPSP
jgi:hypothetical protein